MTRLGLLPRNQWPVWISAEQSDGQVNIRGQLQPELTWLSGHFPGEPILPGIVQLNWSIGLGQLLLGIQGEVVSVQSLKFQQIMIPGDQFTLHIEYCPTRNRLAFQYRRADDFYSQGRVLFQAPS
jgi:3-hydroxymyristoyl/3-hydroxydecanoyl-(acyl carrier protein) dehydratase